PAPAKQSVASAHSSSAQSKTRRAAPMASTSAPCPRNLGMEDVLNGSAVSCPLHSRRGIATKLDLGLPVDFGHVQRPAVGPCHRGALTADTLSLTDGDRIGGHPPAG